MRNNNNRQQQNRQRKQSDVSVQDQDDHHLNGAKLENEKFSVFNRKQMRKQKKIQKKQQKKQIFNNSRKRKNSEISNSSFQSQDNQVKKQQKLSSQQQQQQQQKNIQQRKQSQEIKQKQQKQQQEKEKKPKKAKKQKSELDLLLEQDDEEIAKLEKKLGLGKSNTKYKKQFDKEIKQDGYEDDLFSFLDHIENVAIKQKSKKVKRNEYTPFRGIDQELDEDRGQFYEKFNLEDHQDDSGEIVYNDKMPEVELDGMDQDQIRELEEQYASEIEEEIRKHQEEMENDDEEEEFTDSDQDEEEENEWEDDEDQEEENMDQEDDDDNDDIEDDDEELEGDDEMDSEQAAIEAEIQRRMQEHQQKQSDKNQKKKQKQQQLEQEKQEIQKPKKEEQQEQRRPGNSMLKINRKSDVQQDVQEEVDEGKKKVMDKLEQEQQQQKQELYKQINSNLNKLSEANIDRIFTTIIELFESNPKNLVTPVYSQIFLKLVVEPMNVLTHILSTTSSLLVGLHDMFGNYVFSMVMKELINKYSELEKAEFNSEVDQNDDVNYCQKRNLIQVFSHLYIFGSVSIDFVRGMFDNLIEDINEYNIDLLLILIQFCGHKIRSDNPATLKHIINNVKTAIEKYQAGKQNYSKKTDFILLTLNDLKLNKKVANNPIDRLEFIIAWLKKTVLQKMKLAKNLFALDFKTSLTINKNINKWWEPLNNVETLEKLEAQEEQFFEELQVSQQERRKLEQMAVKYKMGSITRKQIFMTIMSSEDFIDASQRLLKIKLNQKQSREIAVVIIECCSQEKQFNAYYVHLSKKLIEINKNLKYSYQYSLWDRFKQIDSFSPRKISNIAKFAACLCSDYSINLSILKFFNFNNLSQNVTLFLRIFLKEFYTKINAKNLNIVINKMQINKDNNEFMEAFRPYLKTEFLKWVKQNSNSEDFKKAYIQQKVMFTLKKMKLQQQQEENEMEDQYDD